MGSYGDDRMGGDRWRDRGQSNWNRDRDYGRGDYRAQEGHADIGERPAATCRYEYLKRLVEPRGIEPLTSAVRLQRSPI